MPEQRDQNFAQIRRDGRFDVVVVGGGINGIGVFRDLALQGLRVLLVERNDFCSGCSAAPSRMIHGGLRYLENGEFELVRESLRERDALLRNAPHMVRPLPTAIPIKTTFSGLLNGVASFFGLSSKPASRGALPIKIGLMLYDWTTRKNRKLPAHTFLNAQDTFKHWPQLSPHIKFSATYHDAWISYPERLGVELILDTRRTSPECVALNYAEIGRKGSAFEIRDSATGEHLPVQASAIVNATGAWLDESLGDLMEAKDARADFVTGTKGSHLVLDSPALHEALGGHMIYFENADGRVCIVFPYLGRVLAGATDIRVKKPGRVRCEADEREYILDALRLIFPKIPLSNAEVAFTYSGIRPLPRSNQAFTGRISRGHFVHRVEGQVPHFCMVGGKWTTFRAFAEQTADVVLNQLGLPREKSTLDLPIGGGQDFPGMPDDLASELTRDFGISPARAGHLIDAYGTRAREVLEFCRARPDDQPLSSRLLTTHAEIAYLAVHECVVGLADICLRRTPLSIRGQISSTLIETIAAIMADEFGWDAARKRQEIASFKSELSDYHGVSEEMLNQRA